MDRAEHVGAEVAAPGYWERHARRYDRATLALNRSLPELTARVAEDLRGRREVLELAAGTGMFAARIAGTVGRLTATDRAPEMLAILRARLAEVGAAVVGRRVCSRRARRV